MNLFYLFYLTIMMIVFQYWIIKQWASNKTISLSLRNDLLSFAYIIINIGPNVSAFSVVEFLISSKAEDKFTLVMVFFSGLILHYLGRKLRDFIALKTSNKITSIKRTTLSEIAKEKIYKVEK